VARVDTLNPRHEVYIKHLTEELRSEGYAVDSWGYEAVLPDIKMSGVGFDFSLSALQMRSSFDLVVRDSRTGFICHIDGKTTPFRDDTGNVAVEVWPMLFGRKHRVPRLVVFEDIASWGLWLDSLDPSWFSRYRMPDRWDASQQRRFHEMICDLGDDLPQPHSKITWWNSVWASGDPYYLWPVVKVVEAGKPYLVAIQERSTEFGEGESK